MKSTETHNPRKPMLLKSFICIYIANKGGGGCVKIDFGCWSRVPRGELRPLKLGSHEFFGEKIQIRREAATMHNRATATFGLESREEKPYDEAERCPSSRGSVRSSYFVSLPFSF